TDGCLDEMFAWSDLAHVLQRANQADRSMTAHAEIADVVKKDHTCSRRGIDRFTEKCADDGVVSTWFTNDRGAKFVVIASKGVEPFGHRAAPNIGKARDDDASRFTTGVRVDHLDPLFGGHRDDV